MLYINKLSVSKILENINVEFSKGKITTIIGRNGSGKTTLIKAISNLEKYSGEVKKEGHLKLVFQNPDVQFVRNVVEDDIAFGLENLGVPKEEIYNKIQKFSKQYNIVHLLNKSVHKLSGGEKQKVALIANLVCSPDILILDEAFEMIDSKSKEEILNILKDYTKECDLITISVTHDNKVIDYSDYIIGIDKKTIDFKLTKGEFYKNNNLTEKYKVNIPFYAKLNNYFQNKGFELNLCDEKDIKELL